MSAKSRPIVSVVISTYKRPDYLREALDSVGLSGTCSRKRGATEQASETSSRCSQRVPQTPAVRVPGLVSQMSLQSSDSGSPEPTVRNT